MHGALRRQFFGWGAADLAFIQASRDRLSRFPVRLTRRSDRRTFVVSAPSRLRFVAASAYCMERLLGSESMADEFDRLWALAETIEGQLRAAFSPDEIRHRASGGLPELKEALLYVITRRLRPHVVFETGVAQGISTTFLLAALAANRQGRLVSVDSPNRDPTGRVDARTGMRDRSYVPGDRASGWLVPSALRDRWEFHQGLAEEWLPKREDRPDLFFHDSLHTAEHMRFEYDWALAHLARGGVLVSDDIHWNHAFEQFVEQNAGRIRPLSTRYVGVAQLC
jgi:predicted O-methyltransferase YrrM